MKNSALYENPSLDAGDCLVFSIVGLQPGSAQLRCIKEYELILLPAALPIKLNIGDMSVVLTGPQLVLLAPGVPFSWSSAEGPASVLAPLAEDLAAMLPAGVSSPPAGALPPAIVSSQCAGASQQAAAASALILRWPGDLLGDKFLGKNQLHPIGTLFQNALQGVIFSPETTAASAPQLAGLRKKRGFESVYGLLSLLHFLSVATGSRLAADKVYTCAGRSAGDSRVNSAVAFMRANYSQPITLEDVARKARMTKGAFCRSIRKRTGKTYAESLSEIRIDHICSRLLNCSDTVSEIAYQAGFNNVAHFHRCFKRQKGCTPKEFRQSGAGYGVSS
ncbi:MAG TPA: AraC family transcriptional regulator [Puia sp.]|jgi:AraC-like DNA-binding protein